MEARYRELASLLVPNFLGDYMLILSTITMTYHYFRLKTIKSLSSEIDEKSKDYKENMNHITNIFDGCNLDEIDSKSKEIFETLIKSYDSITYLKLYNVQYYALMMVKVLIFTFITLISMAIFGAVLGPIIKIVIGLEIIICMHDFYIGMKEKGMNK